MSTTAYNFTHTDGSQLGTIYALESNGPGASSVPIQIREIDFSHASPELIIDADITSRFPAAAVNGVGLLTYVPAFRILTISGDYTASGQVDAGCTITLFNTATNDALECEVLSHTLDSGNNTMIEVTDSVTLPSSWALSDIVVSSVRGLTIVGGAYAGHYVVDEAGAYTDDDSMTHIPINDRTPLAAPSYDIVAASPGVNGSVVVEDSANGSSMFRVGSQFTLSGNSFPAANTNYVVNSVETSGSYTITAVTDATITIAGNHAKLFVSNKRISIGGGAANNVQLTIASASSSGGATIITTVEPVPSTVAASATLVCVPAMTAITVAGTVPAGIGVDGVAIPANPSTYTFSAPPAITPTTPNNFLITWRIAGNHVGEFAAGSPVLIKNNGFYKYNEFPIHSVSFSNNMTHIVVATTTQTAHTPTPDATGVLIYPVPASDYGYMTCTVGSAFTSMKLVGKGSPSYNATTTWGQAIQDNIIALTENSATGVYTSLVELVPGIQGKLRIPLSNAGNNALKVGATVQYTNDSGDVDTSFTITAVDVQPNYVEVTVDSISASYAGDGVMSVEGLPPTSALVGQQWYDKSSPQLNVYTSDDVWHGVVVQTMPANEFVDMGANQIVNMADPSSPADAVNLRTADRLYIAKTGGYSANAADRSGSMTGSLNFGSRPTGADWSSVGINMADANQTMFADASIQFDADSTGNIVIEGTGSIDVKQGHVQVGDGINNYVTIQNHAGASPTVTFTTATTNNDSLNMGSNKIINVSTPTLAGDAANKAYVDSLSNGIVWLQPVLDPNLFRDDLNTPPFITAAVVGVSTGTTNYWKIAGNWAGSFAAGQILTITDNTLPAANGSYVVVSAANNGANTDITVTASTIPVGAGTTGTATDTSVPTHKTFIVGTSPTGAWVGLSRRAVVYTTISIDPVTQVQTWGWKDILGRQVQVGDRFGVFVEPDAEDPLNILPAGGLTSSAGKIATISSTSPLSYTFYTPTEPYAFSVTGVSPTLNSNAGSTQSPHFGHSYTFRGTYGTGSYGSNYKWIEFAGPSMFAAGGGLKYAGNVLNVGAGAGIIVNADTVQLDNTYASGIYVRLDGQYAMTGNLKMGGNTINNVAAPTLGTDGANKTYVDNQDALRVAKSGDSMSGTLTFTSGTVTGIAYPSANQDAASKVYVDNQTALRVSKSGDTMTGSLVMNGAGVGITLPNAPVVATDAVNKAYTDSKLALTGGTLTGTLTLAGNPVGNLDAATKQYVDNGFVKVTASTSLNSGVNVTFTGNGEVLGLPVTPTTAGSATSKAYVDAQLALKATDSLAVHLAGTETITGAKTFTAATTVNNVFAVAANGSTNNLSITASGITLTGTPVISGGASAITITGGVNSGGIGGNVSFIGGNGSTTGGDVVLTGGQGSAGTGGNVTITTGIGSTTAGQLSLTAGSASIRLMPSGVIQIGGAVPTAKSQALCSDLTNPGTATPTWQLVGTRVASAPANSAAPGIIGNWFADDSYFYVYGATGWRRMAISTF